MDLAMVPKAEWGQVNSMCARINAAPNVIWGDILSEEVTVPAGSSPMLSFLSADFHVRKRVLDLSKEIVSKHLLMIGGIGSGKTNTVNHVLDYLDNNMTENDVMVVFDTKGDFYSLFFEPCTDYVIGNSPMFLENTRYWNIFREIEFGGRTRKEKELMAKEIAKTLFENRKNNTQPFFTSAASDLFSKVLIGTMRKYLWNLPEYRKLEEELQRAHRDVEIQERIIRQQRDMFCDKADKLNNKYLTEEVLQQWEGKDYIELLSDPNNKDFKSANTYIGNGTSNQALGVFGELNSMVNEYFVGIFGDYEEGRDISMRELIHNKGGRKIFIEYDLSIGQVLAPVYALLIDLALKEALGRTRSEGNVFLIIDEFKLLPAQLNHIEDSLNFGRSLGVKVVAGIQSIKQLEEVYGEAKGQVIAAGFSNIFAFRMTDEASRKYVSELFGKNYVSVRYTDSKGNTSEPEREGYTVEDWHLMNLQVGQAVVGITGYTPFLFRFEEYKE